VGAWVERQDFYLVLRARAQTIAAIREYRLGGGADRVGLASEAALQRAPRVSPAAYSFSVVLARMDGGLRKP
jgi:hypothetical protein